MIDFWSRRSIVTTVYMIGGLGGGNRRYATILGLVIAEACAACVIAPALALRWVRASDSFACHNVLT